ncbi:MAG: hypothetical protein RM368_11205 [Nostoc sp. DedSLP03]|nr:hypothetical protein [Nostoc sp. DedSLP03]
MLFCTQYWCCTSQKVRSLSSERRRSLFLEAQRSLIIYSPTQY